MNKKAFVPRQGQLLDVVESPNGVPCILRSSMKKMEAAELIFTRTWPADLIGDCLPIGPPVSLRASTAVFCLKFVGTPLKTHLLDDSLGPWNSKRARMKTTQHYVHVGENGIVFGLPRNATHCLTQMRFTEHPRLPLLQKEVWVVSDPIGTRNRLEEFNVVVSYSYSGSDHADFYSGPVKASRKCLAQARYLASTSNRSAKEVSLEIIRNNGGVDALSQDVPTFENVNNVMRTVDRTRQLRGRKPMDDIDWVQKEAALSDGLVYRRTNGSLTVVMTSRALIGNYLRNGMETEKNIADCSNDVRFFIQELKHIHGNERLKMISEFSNLLSLKYPSLPSELDTLHDIGGHLLTSLQFTNSAIDDKNGNHPSNLVAVALHIGQSAVDYGIICNAVQEKIMEYYPELAKHHRVRGVRTDDGSSFSSSLDRSSLFIGTNRILCVQHYQRTFSRHLRSEFRIKKKQKRKEILSIIFGSETNRDGDEERRVRTMGLIDSVHNEEFYNNWDKYKPELELLCPQFPQWFEKYHMEHIVKHLLLPTRLMAGQGLRMPNTNSNEARNQVYQHSLKNCRSLQSTVSEVQKIIQGEETRLFFAVFGSLDWKPSKEKTVDKAIFDSWTEAKKIRHLKKFGWERTLPDKPIWDVPPEVAKCMKVSTVSLRDLVSKALRCEVFHSERSQLVAVIDSSNDQVFKLKLRENLVLCSCSRFSETACIHVLAVWFSYQDEDRIVFFEEFVRVQNLKSAPMLYRQEIERKRGCGRKPGRREGDPESKRNKNRELVHLETSVRLEVGTNSPSGLREKYRDRPNRKRRRSFTEDSYCAQSTELQNINNEILQFEYRERDKQRMDLDENMNDSEDNHALEPEMEKEEESEMEREEESEIEEEEESEMGEAGSDNETLEVIKQQLL